jgi:hypothetical protein
MGMIVLWICIPEEMHYEYGNWSGLGEVQVYGKACVSYYHNLSGSWHSHEWVWGRFGIVVYPDLIAGTQQLSTPYPMVLSLYLPYWLIILLFAVLPSAWTLNRLRTRKNDLNLCGTCSYSLTGNTSGICPECGTPVPKEIAEKSPRTA